MNTQPWCAPKHIQLNECRELSNSYYQLLIPLNRIHRVVRDDPKLSNDSGELSKPNGAVGGSILGHESVSLLDRILARWQKNTSCVKKSKQSKQNFNFLKRTHQQISRNL